MTPSYTVTADELNDMSLHDIVNLSNSISILRVFGGWIYFVKDTGYAKGVSSVFVKDPSE